MSWPLCVWAIDCQSWGTADEFKTTNVRKPTLALVKLMRINNYLWESGFNQCRGLEVERISPRPADKLCYTALQLIAEYEPASAMLSASSIALQTRAAVSMRSRQRALPPLFSA
ncbi:hypothetical protein [Pokkaliibacter plantistimulans]|uniref:hypothetical protein n=1 Tax=Pokkaliibacter plantistimulans TaxID=1635171 RepID=UPI001057CB51|nr:hypothetical protein [Pokkaliibacter plantistimulans]